MIQPAKQYIQQSIAEIRKVSWPSREKTTQYTMIVVGTCVAAAAILGGLDYGLSYLLRTFVL